MVTIDLVVGVNLLEIKSTLTCRSSYKAYVPPSMVKIANKCHCSSVRPARLRDLPNNGIEVSHLTRLLIPSCTIKTVVQTHRTSMATSQADCLPNQDSAYSGHSRYLSITTSYNNRPKNMYFWA